MSFQHTYEGLKLDGVEILIRRECRFQHTYEGLKPWRGLPWKSLLFSFSAYLWGIETQPNRIHLQGVYEFSAYLWGIETIVPWPVVAFNVVVFSIPMRDWNLAKKPPHHAVIFPRFQHTYEGLKLNIPGAFGVVEFSFQHTYEGLKHNLPHVHRHHPGVFSIPMRDWNFVSSSSTTP